MAHADSDTLREIRRRLVSIHYALVEGPYGDRDLERRTRERLMDLLEYVDEAMSAERPAR